MKNASLTRNLLLCALSAVPLFLSPVRGWTADPSTTEALQVIRGNADAARANAAIYQWKRVNYEVERVISAERSIEITLSANSELAAKAPALHEAIAGLRSGRRAHDSKRTQNAAQQVSEICWQMLR